MAQRQIPEKETISVEFKSDTKKLSDSEIIDTLTALCNTDGGTLFLGVEDDGTPTGVHKSHQDTTRLAAFIANKTVPPVSARVETVRLDSSGCVSEDGVQVAIVEVPRSQAIVASTDGRIMRRRQKADGSPESVPLYPYEIITRLSTIGQMDYSAFPAPDSSTDDLDPEEILRLRSILQRNRNSGDHALIELPDDELLSALRMTTAVNGKTTPTITGILLVGKQEALYRCVPTATASFQVLEGTEVRVNQEYRRPILYTIETIREMFVPWNPSREVNDGLFRQSVPEFDERAFREALVNAFGHRDYAAMGSVRTLVDDEGLTISNPGGLVEGLSVATLLTAEPRGRNECLMSALKRVGLAERTGRGIDRIFEGSLAYGRPAPDYSGTNSAGVRVFIARSAPDEAFMRMLNDEASRTGKPLSLRSLLVLDALKTQRRLTTASLSEQLHFTIPSVRATVEVLVESGIVVAVGNGSSRSYMLSNRIYKENGCPSAFVRQSDVDKVRWPELVLKLAKQQGGTVATKEVQELLRIERKASYRLLKKLEKEGTLISEGSGPATRYRIV